MYALESCRSCELAFDFHFWNQLYLHFTFHIKVQSFTENRKKTYGDVVSEVNMQTLKEELFSIDTSNFVVPRIFMKADDI